MRILQAPHPSLRATAKPITEIDDMTHQYLEALRTTLATAKNPRGVGLASPQVETGANERLDLDQPLRVFATQFDPNQTDLTTLDGIDLYLNPRIESHSNEKIIEEDNQFVLEGCLSIRNIYGPAPRWEWVEIAYETVGEAGNLESDTKRFEAFDARVVQHEIDHLDGVLFTDYILEYDLPVYTDKTEDGSLERMTSTAPLEML